MNTKFRHSLLTLRILYELIITSEQSITGVTYKDDVGFVDRYANPLECDPIYWHPLHMPQRCAQKFEKIIRSRLMDNEQRIQSVQMEKMLRMYKKATRGESDDSDESTDTTTETEEEDNSFPYITDVQQGSMEDLGMGMGKLVPYDIPYGAWPAPPYRAMLDMLQKDVMRLPVEPEVGIVPHVGLAAIYRQPVSQNTIDVINTVGRKYAQVANEAGVVWNPEGPPRNDTFNDIFEIDPSNNSTEMDHKVKEKIAMLEKFMNHIEKEIEQANLEEDKNGLTKKTVKLGDAEAKIEWRRPKNRTRKPKPSTT